MRFFQKPILFLTALGLNLLNHFHTSKANKKVGKKEKPVV